MNFNISNVIVNIMISSYIAIIRLRYCQSIEGSFVISALKVLGITLLLLICCTLIAENKDFMFVYMNNLI